MVNDMTIMYGIIVFFVIIGVLAPFLNASFDTDIPETSASSLYEDIDENDVTSTVSTFRVITSVFSMFFWTFGSLPLFIDAVIFTPLRIILAVIIARNIWIGGGG